MSKRQSWKKQRDTFNQVFERDKYIAAQREARNTVENKPWLEMSDDDIDRAYYHFGKADRTRMKKEARIERLRLEVRKALEEE